MYNDVNIIENLNKPKCLSKGYQIRQHNKMVKSRENLGPDHIGFNLLLLLNNCITLSKLLKPFGTLFPLI